MDVVASGDDIRDAIGIIMTLAVPVFEPPGPPWFGWNARFRLIRDFVGPDSCRGLQVAWAVLPAAASLRGGFIANFWH